MSAHEPSPEQHLAGAVGAMGAGLFKVLPSRRWVQDRSTAVWGDMEAFESAPAGLATDQGTTFAEMAA